MRDQPRISVAGETMGKRRRESIEHGEDSPSQPMEPSKDDLLERIRQLEEEKRRLEEEKRRLEEENEIFRKFLESNGKSADSFIEEYKTLLHRVRMNSSNSSKPPSSDGYRKPTSKSRRRSTGNRPGGQPGHEGHHLLVPKEPDEVKNHYPPQCERCSRKEECCSAARIVPIESRYVIEAEMSIKVIEHRKNRATCPMASMYADDPRWEEPGTGSFPDDVKAHVQYGKSFTVLVGLLDAFGAVSDSRNSALINCMFKVPLSAGTVKNMRRECAMKIGPIMERIREIIAQGDVCHSDETGVRVNGKLMWVHNTSTPEYTYQTISCKRGVQGIEENGIVPEFDGTVVHDCWGPYFKYTNVTHAVCCAHLLRELEGIKDLEPCHVWPGHFADLLIKMKTAKESAQADGLSELTRGQLDRFSAKYDWVLDMADTECPPPTEPNVKKRGRRKKGKERSLIERLRTLKDEVCRFVHDFRVPFDNNQAERDLRGIKSKYKVAGGFRSSVSTQEYLTISSFLNSARKKGVSMYEALTSAIEGRVTFVP